MNRKFTDHATTHHFLSPRPEEIQFEVGRWYKNDRPGGKYFLCVSRTRFSASFYEEDVCDDNLVDTGCVVTYMFDYTWSGTMYYEFVRSKDLQLRAADFAMEEKKPIVQDFELYTPAWQDGMG